jgi:hypothetical protein
MNRERLKQCLRVLDNYNPGAGVEFRMSLFINHCGTAACAVGLCGLDPWFQERGFKALHDCSNVVYLGVYTLYRGFKATELFFNIDRDTCKWLFLGSSYHTESEDITPAMVAGRIRHLLEHGHI